MVIYILIIMTQTGDLVLTVHLSRPSASNELFAYVVRHWSNLDLKMPDLNDECVELYFERMGDMGEHYYLEERKLDGLDNYALVPKDKSKDHLVEEEVIMDENELRIAYWAVGELKAENAAHIFSESITKEYWTKALMSTYEKLKPL